MKRAEKLGDQLTTVLIVLGGSGLLGFGFAMAVPAAWMIGMEDAFKIISGIFGVVFVSALVAIFVIFFKGNSLEKGNDKASIATGQSTQFVTIISKYAYDEYKIMQFPTEPGEVESGRYYIQVGFASGDKDEVIVSESLYFSVGEMMKGNATISKRKMSSFTPVVEQQNNPLNESEWTRK